MVLNAGRFYGRLFGTERGVTQGGPVYPTIFNNVVVLVVRGPDGIIRATSVAAWVGIINSVIVLTCPEMSV